MTPIEELARLEAELDAANTAHHAKMDPWRRRIGVLIEAEKRWWRISDRLAVEIVPGTVEMLRAGDHLCKDGRGCYVSGNVHLLMLMPDELRVLAEVRALAIAYESRAWDRSLPVSGEWMDARQALLEAKGAAWLAEHITGVVFLAGAV